MAELVLDRGEVYKILPHGHEFQVIDRLTLDNTSTPLEGSAAWYISNEEPRLASVEDLPYVFQEQDKDGQYPFHIVSTDQWLPFRGHYPLDPERSLGPIAPGITGVSAACQLLAVREGVTGISYDIQTLDQARFKRPLFPGTKGFARFTNANGKDIIKFIGGDDEKDLIELRGLVAEPVNDSAAGEIIVPTTTLLELAAQAAGAILLKSRGQDDDTDNGMPLFIGVDDVETFNRAQLGVDEVIRVKLSDFGTARKFETASASIVAGEGSHTRQLATVGKLIFGFDDKQ